MNERSTFALYRAHSPSPSFPKAPLLKSLAIGLCTRDPFGVYPFQMHKSSSIVRKYISIYWCPVNFWGRNRSVGPKGGKTKGVEGEFGGVLRVRKLEGMG